MKPEIITAVANGMIAEACAYKGMPIATIDTLAKEGRPYWLRLAEAAVRATLKTPQMQAVMEQAAKYRDLSTS